MQGTIARALEIARSGECKTLREMEIRLTKEGYENAAGHLNGQTIRKQLYKAMREAQLLEDSASNGGSMAALSYQS